MNVIWTPDAVRSFSGVDISVAVATDRGFVTPVLRGINQMKAEGGRGEERDAFGRPTAD